MSNQLIKTTEQGKENVFPRTRIQDLFDKTSGQKLMDILNSFNMMFVSYLGNKFNTRNQISPELRRQGLWLTYVIDNTVYTEWYDEVAIDDTNWGSDSNWRQGSNALVGDLSVSPNGTWVINGEDSGITIKGDKGDSPVIRIYNNKIQVSYDKGVTYEDLNNTPVYTKFRFNSQTNTYQVSYDLGETWSNISDEKIYYQFRYNAETNTHQVSTDLGQNWTDISSNKVYYQFRTGDNRLQVSTDLGTTWENCSEPIAAWFRWADVSGTGNIGKVQISRDNNTWEDLSPTMTNNLYIKDYVSTIGDLPSNAAIGDIYMVGPTYEESDTTQDYPHYRMWIKQSSGWKDNGEYQSNIQISQTPGQETGITMSQKAITNAIVYDVSAYNNGAVFESLQSLLSSSNLDTLIPTSVRHGGMTIRFIKGSVSNSDNKYEQAYLMANEFTTNVEQWQTVDKVPTANSHNLVESNGVSSITDKITFDSTENILDDRTLLLRDGIRINDEKAYYGKIDDFSGASINIATTEYPYILSFYAKVDQSLSPLGNGLRFIATYQNDETVVVHIPNTTSVYTQFSLIIRNTLKSISVSYGSGGKNIIYIKELQLRKGNTVLSYVPHNTVVDCGARKGNENAIEEFKNYYPQTSVRIPNGVSYIRNEDKLTIIFRSKDVYIFSAGNSWTLSLNTMEYVLPRNNSLYFKISTQELIISSQILYNKDYILFVSNYNGNPTSGCLIYYFSRYNKNNILANIGYGLCKSGSDNTNKVTDFTDITLSNKIDIKLKMLYKNTAENVTLNISNSGAMPLYYKGEPVSATNTWKDNEIVGVFYDGANYQAYPIPVYQDVPTVNVEKCFGNDIDTAEYYLQTLYENMTDMSVDNIFVNKNIAIHKNKGNEIASDYYLASDYIFLKQGVKVDYSVTSSNSNIALLAVYNVSKVFQSAPVIGASDVYQKGTYTAQTDCYIRICSYTGSGRNKHYLKFNGIDDTLFNRINKLEDAAIYGGLPYYWREYLATKNKDISNSIANVGAHGDIFILFSDAHITLSEFKSPAVIKYLMSRFNIQKTVFGGDIFNSFPSKDEALSSIENFIQAFNDVSLYNIYGNHDGNTYGTGAISINELYPFLFKNLENKPNVSLTSNGYYYFDNPYQKIRYVVLNTYNNGFDLTNADCIEQLNWFVNTLNSVQDGWYVVVLTHIFFEIYTIEGVKTPDKTRTGIITQQIVDAYQSKNSVTLSYDGVSLSYNFSQANGKVAAIFTGHVHYDYSINSPESYPIISILEDSTYYLSSMPDNPTRTAGTYTEQALDVVCIDTENKVIKTIRIGAGEDRIFSFT